MLIKVIWEINHIKTGKKLLTFKRKTGKSFHKPNRGRVLFFQSAFLQNCDLKGLVAGGVAWHFNWDILQHYLKNVKL
jgi:hypothetical protein